MKFLNESNTQSTLRVVVFMMAVMVCFNLGLLPVLMALTILLGQDMGWLGIYLAGLATLSGTGILGKVIQKKYETKGAPVSEETSI